MNAIFKYENTYVFVVEKKVREGIDLDNCNELIIDDGSYKKNNNLYGGRLKLNATYGGYCKITIDGIIIKRFHYKPFSNKSDYWFDVEDQFGFSQVAAILNQIENLGVDSFLDNYKKELQNLKEEFEKLSESWQQELAVNDDKDKKSNLKDLKNILVVMSCIIFSLLINMNAGLDNNHYINAYDAIVSMYF